MGETLFLCLIILVRQRKRKFSFCSLFWLKSGQSKSSSHILTYTLIKRNCHLLFLIFLDYVNDYYFLNLCSNQGLLFVLLVTQMVLLNANGAVVLVSSFSVTTCSAKSRPGTPAVSSVLARALCAARIVKEQVFGQSGWDSLLSPTHQFPSSKNLSNPQEETASTDKDSHI